MTFDFTTIDWKVIIAALALLVAVFVALYFQWWRNRKRLSYEILSDVLLISAEKEIEDKVEIRYEGQAVKNVHLLVIKLINDGYVPIKKDEFEKSVKFIFPDAKILTSEKVKFHPDNIGTQIAYRDDWIEIDPVLFNRKDYVQFKVLLSGYHNEMKIDARIVGVSVIGRTRRIRSWSDKLTSLIIMGIFFWTILIGLSLISTPTPGEYLWVKIIMVLIVASLCETLVRNWLRRSGM